MNNSNLYPHFSIITVTYNAGEYLERTLQSVACQTYTRYDYHIIDGGSIDSTMTLCSNYRSIIEDVISEPDKGLYDAMNKGIKRATGDYICFLNAGDQLKDAHTLQNLADAILASGDSFPDVVYGETEIVDNQGNFVRMRRLKTPEVLNWKSFQDGMLVCHQAFWARRELALQESYDLNYRFSADFDWCIRIMKRATTLLNSRQTIIRYLQEGMTTRNHRASLLERFRIMAKHYGFVSTFLHHVWFVARAIVKR